MHLGALLASLVGSIFLLARGPFDPLHLVGLGVYAFGMAACFLGSVGHHLVRGTREREMWLLKLDHAAIYLFIAGTYTPVCLFVLATPAALWLLGLVWALAAVGVVYKLGFAPDQADVNDPPGLVDTLLYIAMGWLSVTQASALYAHSRPGTFALVLAGGAAYSFGAIVLARRWLELWPGRFGHHEFWHVFVMLGTACVYAYIWLNLAVG